MNFIVYIILCLFASIGLVQVLGWIITAARAPGHAGNGCCVIPLRGNAEEMEWNLRRELSCLRWGGSGAMNPLVLLDTGLDKEALAICERLVSDRPGILICTPEELSRIVAGS